jgi:DNA-binding IclR family transcriptional regulator
VFGKDGTAVAAINIAASTSILSDELIDGVIPVVLKTAERLSSYFGYLPDPADNVTKA